MIPSFREPLMDHFGGDMAKATECVDQYIAAWTEAGAWPAEGKFAPWSPELYHELAADTFQKEQYP